jgi:hypothetical protein
MSNTCRRSIGVAVTRHRAVEFRRFLTTAEQAVPADLDMHLVLSHYSAHKAPGKTCFARHPRQHLHSALPRASWLNQVERWFARLV